MTAPTPARPTAGAHRRPGRSAPDPHPEPGPTVGWPRRPLLLALWSSAALLLVLRVAQGVQHDGYDFAVVYQAGRDLLHGRPVYDDPLFLYLPSSALLAAPAGVLGWPIALGLTTALGCAAVVWSCWGSVRLLAPATAAWVPAVAVVTISASAAGGALFEGVNVEFLTFAALPLLYRWAADGRWGRFGLLLGAALAVKPILAGLLLLPLLARRWRAAAVAVGIPVLLSAAALLVTGTTWETLSTVLAHVGGPAQPAFQDADASIAGIARSFGVSGALVLVARCAALALGLVAAVLRWRQDGDPALRVTETGTLVLLTSVVAGSLAWQHYALLAVPALLLAAHPGSLTRRAWGVWPCLVPLLVVVPSLPAAAVAPWNLGSRAGLAILAVLVLLSGTVITDARRRDGSAGRRAGAPAQPADRAHRAVAAGASSQG